jgi:hypothetical protein
MWRSRANIDDMPRQLMSIPSHPHHSCTNIDIALLTKDYDLANEQSCPPDMDEYTVNTFANREEPIPLVAGPQNEAETPSPDPESRRSRMKKYLSSTHLKSKAQDIVASQLDKHELSAGNRMSLQDRVFSK